MPYAAYAVEASSATGAIYAPTRSLGRIAPHGYHSTYHFLLRLCVHMTPLR